MSPAHRILPEKGMAALSSSSTTPSPERRVSSEETEAAMSSSQAPEVFKPTAVFYVAMTMMAILTLVVALDVTALAVALPIVAEKLGGSGLQAFWSGTGYLLCGTVFQPVVGGISTLFGRVYIVGGSTIIFLAGCLGSALAQDFDTLLICRAFQGVGGGGLVVMSEVLVCDMIPLRQRGEWFGLLSGMYAVGTVLGPIIGGLFAQHATWRWIFWINIPLIVISLALVPFAIKVNTPPTPFMSRVKRVDYVGCVLIVGSAVSFMIGVSWGGVQFAWSAWQTILPIVLGLVGCIAFFFYEEHVAVEPVVPTSVFKNLNCSASYINTVIHGIVVLSLVFYLPLYYEGVKGYNTTITGVALFPETFTVAPAAVIIGVLIGKLGRFRWAHWSGWTISVLGMGILWLLDVDTSTVKWIFLNLVGGAGTGFLYPAHQFSIQAATANEHLAAAVSMWSFFRSVGQTLGIAVGGVILQNQLLHNISKYPNLAANAVEYSRSASSLATMLRTMAPSQDKTDLRQAYADSLKVIWATMCGLAFLGLLISFLIKDYPLDRLLPEAPTAHDKQPSETSSEHNPSETKTELTSSNMNNV